MIFQINNVLQASCLRENTRSIRAHNLPASTGQVFTIDKFRYPVNKTLIENLNVHKNMKKNR
jgi:hypothetical protein